MPGAWNVLHARVHIVCRAALFGHTHTHILLSELSRLNRSIAACSGTREGPGLFSSSTPTTAAARKCSKVVQHTLTRTHTRWRCYYTRCACMYLVFSLYVLHTLRCVTIRKRMHSRLHPSSHSAIADPLCPLRFRYYLI